MKIILSRKGFDSANGGVPNPILPGGELCVLPIPEQRSCRAYQDISLPNVQALSPYPNVGALVADLTGGRIGAAAGGHLDPDLTASSVPRQQGWRPAFGQTGAALGHLQNQQVGGGDLFLFYGWFRRVELVAGRLQYVAQAPDLHVIYGWLQVDFTLFPYAQLASALPAWLAEHPHCAPGYRAQNAIYVSREWLSLPGLSQPIAGGGVFPLFCPALQLTAAESAQRSQWRLPGWFYPQTPAQALSYHQNMARWQQQSDAALLRSVGRGQEFVLDCTHYAESAAWLQSLFTAALSNL